MHRQTSSNNERDYGHDSQKAEFDISGIPGLPMAGSLCQRATQTRTPVVRTLETHTGAEKYKDAGFTVIAVNQMEDPEHVFAFIGQLDTDPTFPMLFDPESLVSGAYGVKGLPTTFLIDKQGLVRYRAIGGREFDHPEVEAQIERLMRE